MNRLFRSSTSMVSLSVGIFVSIIATIPILWAQDGYTPIVMWGSEGEGDGQFSGLNDVISQANISMFQIMKITECKCLPLTGSS
jgi:hypothetical protein